MVISVLLDFDNGKFCFKIHFCKFQICIFLSIGIIVDANGSILGSFNSFSILVVLSGKTKEKLDGLFVEGMGSFNSFSILVVLSGKTKEKLDGLFVEGKVSMELRGKVF